MSWWSVELALKSSDVYSWGRTLKTTICRYRPFVFKCPRKIHIGESWHICLSFSIPVVSLLRVMLRGKRNVSLLWTVVSDLRLSISTHSIHRWYSTLHYQCSWGIILESNSMQTNLNGVQLRQVYPITDKPKGHSQIQCDNTKQRTNYQRWVIWEMACLIIIVI